MKKWEEDLYGINFAIEYYSNMKGFENFDSALTFINILESNAYILASDEVYNNTYGKLLNAHLKARYTKLRKKSGFKK